MKSVLVVGPAFCDLFLQGFKAIPNKGKEIYLEDYNISLGGMAITAAALAQLEIPAVLLTSLGEDSFGRQISQDLQRRGVHLPAHSPESLDKTNLTVVFPLEGDRGFLTCEQNPQDFKHSIEQKLENTDPADFRHIHISFSLMSSKKIRIFLRKVRQLGGTVSSDIAYDDVMKWNETSVTFLRELDFFLPNIEEALSITGTKDWRSALEHLREDVPYPIITMGELGAASVDEEGKAIQLPAPVIEVANTSGAGDSFTAGFLFGLFRGGSIADALQNGIMAGCLTAASRDSVAPEICPEALLKDESLAG